MARPLLDRMSHGTPWMMTVNVESSPGTENGSSNLVSVEMVAAAGPVGEVLR